MKNTYIITEEEKNRILSMHESATKRQYLGEQADYPNATGIDILNPKSKELYNKLKWYCTDPQKLKTIYRVQPLSMDEAGVSEIARDLIRRLGREAKLDPPWQAEKFLSILDDFNKRGADLCALDLALRANKIPSGIHGLFAANKLMPISWDQVYAKIIPAIDQLYNYFQGGKGMETTVKQPTKSPYLDTLITAFKNYVSKEGLRDYSEIDFSNPEVVLGAITQVVGTKAIQ